MAYVKPKRCVFRYELACVDGQAFVGHYDDDTVYYNIVAVRLGAPEVVNARRIIARAHTLDKAHALVAALNELTC